MSEAAPSPESPLQPYDLTTERRVEPVGIDDLTPVLAWKLAGSGRARRQAGYRVRVVHDADPRDESVSPVWDSGVVETDRTFDVPYDGEPLLPRSRYVWSVRVVDENGGDSGWSAPAAFETGLLGEAAWSEGTAALWIESPSEPGAQGSVDLDTGVRHRKIERIWLPRYRNSPIGAVRFRTRLELPEGAVVERARLFADAGEGTTARADVNGVEVACAGDDPGSALRSGDNVLTIEIAVASARQPGLVARLEIAFADRDPIVVSTDGSWECAVDSADWVLAESYGLHGGPPLGRSSLSYRPSPYLRKGFVVPSTVRRARLYATALGIYEATLNGRRVGDHCFAPGWTEYNDRLQYQVYDVTELLSEGANAIGVILADGWYAGNVGWYGQYRYGDRRAFRARLEIEYDDGTSSVVTTDDTWRVGEGEIRFADLQQGEVVDHRLERPGWDLAAFDDSGWPAAVAVAPAHGPLESQVSPPIRILHSVSPKSVEQREPGRYIVDFGQNLVGWVRLRVQGNAGHRVLLRHTEVLNHENELYIEALRSARAADEYILRGDFGAEVFEPKFTVHGFRYCEVFDHPGELDPSDITALVAYADMDQIGEFSCSDARLDRLQQNVVWGQRGNFLAVPTDCPQRDERLGWTGDAQVFASTAAFNYDVRGFLRKWMRDLRDGQKPDGGVPHVAPDILSSAEGTSAAGAAGWGDAAVIVPFELYRAYGDLRAISEAYESVVSWLEYLEQNSNGLVRPDEGFADWLATTATPRDLVSTAFFAYAAKLAAESAGLLGLDADQKRWTELYTNVRKAYRERFVRGGGEVVSGTQTAYVLSLYFGLLEPDEEPYAAARLVDEIAGRNWHLATGFLGTPYLLEVLSRFGHEDVAFKLLAQDTYPSWLYPVVHGDATTIWERWDSWSDSRGFQDPAMTSFNHYAYGAVGEWMYRTIGGLAPGEPGYRHVVVRPRPGAGITWAKAALESPYGRIATDWRLDGDRFGLDVTLPPNTTAEVWLPGADEPVRIGSGVHSFTAG